MANENELVNLESCWGGFKARDGQMKHILRVLELWGEGEI